MSTNGEQAAAHKQQQSTTPASPQPPPQGPDHGHPPSFVQLAPHPGPYALPPGAFSPVFFGHPNSEGMVNHGDPNVPQYLPYTQMMYVYPPPIPGQGNKFGCFLLDFQSQPLHSTPISPSRSPSVLCRRQGKTQASQNGCMCPVPMPSTMSY
jgi:hypothetical protein